MTEQPPTQPSDSPVVLTVLAGRAWEARLNTALRAHGLSLRHLGALGHLAELAAALPPAARAGLTLGLLAGLRAAGTAD